ncbi:hypothetical protein AWC05_11205 [Mycobacterium florentinum]|uniref:Uncharacterized protein n=1 Tax=Mycobacterium florentinum TaxID=292462 RepID=A0A1X1UGH4_MYCFL|nr:hypothetical protein [Mycobacterium florentinum]MCV7413133.1 hypothetical protein [Mycobacterium florentinum]ORV55759.1 hypothetical protein AWC05_11205 [Mycobacterium florentinum]BBX76656.1 hypothetical protein MFLOJ_04430 [Mycobacterium florentinum]
MLHIEEYVGIILGVARTHRAKALANPDQPHSAVIHELQRYIEAHNPGATDVNVVRVTDTGQADKTHKPVRHWYQVTYEV